MFSSISTRHNWIVSEIYIILETSNTLLAKYCAKQENLKRFNSYENMKLLFFSRWDFLVSAY